MKLVFWFNDGVNFHASKRSYASGTHSGVILRENESWAGQFKNDRDCQYGFKDSVTYDSTSE